MTSVSRHRNLESAFAPTARAEGLASLLPAKKPQAAPGERDQTVSEVEHKPAAAGPRKRTPRGQVETPATTRPEPRPGPTSSTVRNAGIYLPPETLDVVRAETRQRGITYADLLVEAFDTTKPDAIARAFTPDEPDARPGGMPRRAPRPTGAPGIQRQFRLSDEQIAWLDRQKDHYGAPSRSALVATVLETYFQERGGGAH